jgi:hypothetical protein
MNTWEELLACYENLPESHPVFYRLYYNKQGQPQVYSMEDLPGDYIEIDSETYHRGPLNVRVINGKLIYLTLRTSEKLVPGDTGTPCHPADVCIVDPDSTTYWSKHFYGEQD